jgi:integrase
VNVARSYLRAAFAYGGRADHDPRTIAQDGILFDLNANPVTQVPRIAEFERTGERVLTESELRAYWNALADLPLVRRAALRFNLALACQRPTQLLRARWPNFDFDENTMVLADIKGRGGSREQLAPLRQLSESTDVDEEAPPFSSDAKRAMVVETLSHAVAEVSAKAHSGIRYTEI